MEPLKGLSTILIKADPFDINGRHYQFRRLGVSDTFKIVNLIKQAAVWGHQEAALALHNFSGLTNTNNLAWLLAPIMGIPEVETALLDFLGDTLRELERVEEKESINAVDIRDAEAFPMGSELIVLANLVVHPDLQSFFSTFGSLKGHPAVINLVETLKAMSETSGQTQ